MEGVSGKILEELESETEEREPPESQPPHAKTMEGAGHQWLTPAILATCEAKIGRLAWSNSSRASISKITRVKWTTGVTQAVDYLLCRHKTLNSNPNPRRKKT
jgi:hypothetical protein